MNELVTHLNKERQRLVGLINSIDNLLSEYRQKDDDIAIHTPSAVIKSMDSNSLFETANPTNVKKGYSLKESVLNAVLTFDRFEKGSKTIPILLQLYPEKINNKHNFQVQVSGLLSDLGKDGKIVKYQYSTSKKDTVWGKPEWLGSDKKPKEGFEPIVK